VIFLKKTVMYFTLIVTLIVFSTATINGEERIASEEEGLILALLEPHMMEAMHHYYGRMRQFDLADVTILEIEKRDCSFCYDVTVELAVNHSNENKGGVDQMTFAINKGKVVPTHYEHKKGISPS